MPGPREQTAGKASGLTVREALREAALNRARAAKAPPEGQSPQQRAKPPVKGLPGPRTGEKAAAAPCAYASAGRQVRLGCGVWKRYWLCSHPDEAIRAACPSGGWPPQHCAPRFCKAWRDPQIPQISADEDQKRIAATAKMTEQTTSSESFTRVPNLRPSAKSADAVPLRLAAVITAFNEGDEVRRTVESLLVSVLDPGTVANVIVIDDGSAPAVESAPFNPKSAIENRKSVSLLRHDVPLGVGRSRNAGTLYALEHGADAVTFHDAHMRFPPGVLEALARKAIESGAIVCSKALGWWSYIGSQQSAEPLKIGNRQSAIGNPPVPADILSPGFSHAGDWKGHAFSAWGAALFWNSREGLQAQYNIYTKHRGQGEHPQIPQINADDGRKNLGIVPGRTARTSEEAVVSRPLSQPPNLRPSAKSVDSVPGRQPPSRPSPGPLSSLPFDRVACPMGACYVMSRETIERLSAPTGRLWDDVAGRWGFSEQALAVKAFLLGIPILVSETLATHHHYKGVNSVPNAGQEVWRNATFSLAALLSEETFDLRFRPFCEARRGPEEANRLIAEARKSLPGPRPWSVEQERQVFTCLCGRAATVIGPHGDHAWLSEIENQKSKIGAPATGAIPALPGAVPAAANPPRILQWRPGESTLLLRRLYPKAEIVCLEWNAHRIQNWQAVLKKVGIAFHRLTLETWADPVKAGLLKSDARFDLITIGGEMADECRPAAEQLLAPGGTILVNPSADSLQVEDKIRHETTAELKKRQQPHPQIPQITADEDQKRIAATAKMTEQITSSLSFTRVPNLRPSAKSADSVTVVLLNWQRAENIGPVLHCLRQQTARPKIMLWNNGEPILVQQGVGAPVYIEKHPWVSFAAHASRNIGCFGRWLLAALADTEYVATLDDDLVLSDPKVLGDAIRAQRELCPDGIVGLFGWQRVEGRPYRGGRHVHGASQDVRVDVIKGRFMVLRRELLARVPIVCPVPGPLVTAEDDIYVSLCVSRGQPGAHLVPGVLGKRWKELGQKGVAAAAQPGHYERRDAMVRRLLSHFAGKDEACPPGVRRGQSLPAVRVAGTKLARLMSGGDEVQEESNEKQEAVAVP